MPWLARTHAVTHGAVGVRAADAAQVAARHRVAAGTDRRSAIRYFSKEQADEAAQGRQAACKVADASNVTRGMPLKRRNSPKLDGVDSAELAHAAAASRIRRDELKSIALALQADPAKVLNLGKDANESKVKTTDLSEFKIVAFATHGLVPGELDGLTQPALALSAPDGRRQRRRRPADDGGDSVASSSTPTGSFCRPATPVPAPAPARRPHRVSAAPSSTPGRARCWSPTGRCIRSRRGN